jgi:hypothetical protein
MVQRRKNRIIQIALILSSIIFGMLWNAKLFVQATGGSTSENTYKVEETKTVEIDGKSIYLSRYHKDHWFAKEEVVCVQAWDVVLRSEEVAQALSEETLEDIIKEKSEIELRNLYDRALIKGERIWIDYEEVQPYENLEGYKSIVYINIEKENESISKECLMILVKVIGNPQEQPTEVEEPREPEIPKEPEIPREPVIYEPPPMMSEGYWRPSYVSPYVPPQVSQEPEERDSAEPEDLNIVESRDYSENFIIESEEVEEVEEIEPTREIVEEVIEKEITPVQAAVIATEGTSSLLLGLSIFSDVRLLKWLKQK